MLIVNIIDGSIQTWLHTWVTGRFKVTTELNWTEYVVSSITFDQLILAFFYLFRGSCTHNFVFDRILHLFEYTKLLKTIDPVTIYLILGWLCKCCARFFLTDVGFGHLRVGFDHITLSHLQPENFQYYTRMQKCEYDTIHGINGWPTIWNIPEPGELFIWTLCSF